ncbi:MAG: OmpA family protein [Natronohydrobacter sp.]|nr:OmpA family protein [Natronohydrobacter sp.]
MHPYLSWLPALGLTALIATTSALVPAVAAAETYDAPESRSAEIRARPELRVPAPEITTEATGRVLTVFFAFDRAELAPEARRALDRIGPHLRDTLRAGKTVFIEGHTDSFGAEAYNHALSERRARAVGDYLRDAWGIVPDQLVFRAWGQSLPRDGATAQSAENRRTEITVAPRRSAPKPCGGQSGSVTIPAHLDIDDFGGAPNPLRHALSDKTPVIISCAPQ